MNKIKANSDVNFRAYDGNVYGAHVTKVRNGVASVEYFARLSNGVEVGVTAYLDRKDWNRLTERIWA